MPSKDPIRNMSGFQRLKYAWKIGTMPWDHEVLSPFTQISLGRKTNLPKKIYELTQSNGKLGSIRKGLGIRVIPEGKVWDPEKATPIVKTDEFGQGLTYILLKELKELIPELKNYEGSLPVILYWREIKKHPS